MMSRRRAALKTNKSPSIINTIRFDMNLSRLPSGLVNFSNIYKNYNISKFIFLSFDKETNKAYAIHHIDYDQFILDINQVNYGYINTLCASKDGKSLIYSPEYNQWRKDLLYKYGIDFKEGDHNMLPHIWHKIFPPSPSQEVIEWFNSMQLDLHFY
jgi:hypothetical protein